MNKEIDLPTVTIGIPAHNEESNIAKLLRSILRQKALSYSLDSIIVTCDGCTDNTAKIVRDISKKHKVIKLLDDGQRLGKPKRLNRFYSMVKSDIFVAFDADVVLANSNVLEEIVKAFDSREVGLVGGRDIPFPASGVFEKIVVTASTLWYETRKNVGNGDTVHNHIARISALHKRAYKKIKIPDDMIADDVYLFFRTIQLGFEFRFAKEAVVYYREPNNLSDFFAQSARHMSHTPTIVSHFGSWVNAYFTTPEILKLKAFIKMFLKEPFYLPLAILLQISLRLTHSKFRNHYGNGKWITVKSTKI